MACMGHVNINWTTHPKCRPPHANSLYVNRQFIKCLLPLNRFELCSDYWGLQFGNPNTGTLFINTKIKGSPFFKIVVVLSFYVILWTTTLHHHSAEKQYNGYLCACEAVMVLFNSKEVPIQTCTSLCLLHWLL